MLAGKEQRCDVGIRPTLRELSGSRDSQAVWGPLWFRSGACEQIANRSLSSSVLVPGQEGTKLASFPEPCACVLVLKKATAPVVEEDLCAPPL